MEIDFKNKNIVVTGAGQGIGRELCNRLYKYGANVLAISRSPEPLSELKAECPNITTISIDISDWNKTKIALKTFKVQEIHGLVNNAAIAIIKSFTDLTEQDVDNTFNVNIKSVFNVTQQVLPKMLSQSSIVNVSSVASIVSFEGHAAYSATKAALDSLTKTLAIELGSRNIRVNSVNPTVVLTKMGRENWSDPAKSKPLLDRIPLHRFAEVDDVVNAIVYLLSEKSSFINGHCMPVEGGLLAS